MSLKNLGSWALLDIETTGIDAGVDDIIDLGFLRFNEGKLVQKFDELVKSDLKVSPFITHLTGITQKMVDKARPWDLVKKDLLDLDEHYLIAHNANFESNFLGTKFSSLNINAIQSELRLPFGDSIPYLALCHPGRSGLSLESFILDYGIATKEEHRGYRDSLDLLKVLICTNWKLKKESSKLFDFIEQTLRPMEDYWFRKFSQLSFEDLEDLATQIDFPIADHFNLELKKVIGPASVQKKQSESLSFNGESIKKAFENGAEIFENYEIRDQQLEMAQRIGQSFAHGIHSLIQAPTGTGKSLAYLIPALSFAKSKKTKVLISTASKVLQNQLLEKDIELAMRFLKNSDIKVTKLIGTQNHLCIAKFEHENFDQPGFFNNFPEEFAKAYFKILFFYNSINETKITREELPYSLKRMFQEFDQMSVDLAIDFKSCLASKCPFIKDCSYFNGLEEAKKSDVLIGNHALTFHWPSSVERPEYIIFDEAHKIEESATGALTTLSELSKLESFLRVREKGNSGLGAMFYLMDSIEDNSIKQEKKEFIYHSFSESLNHLSGVHLVVQKLSREMNNYTDEYWNEFLFLKKIPTPLMTSLVNELNTISKNLDPVFDILTGVYQKFEDKEWEDIREAQAWVYFRSFYNQLSDYCSEISLFLSEDDLYCRSVKFHETYGVQLESCPIDIGKFVHQKILEDSNSVIFTSATLGNMNGLGGHALIDWTTGHLYAEKAKRFQKPLFLECLYDYKNQAKLFFCSDLPPIYTNEYVDIVLLKLIPIIKKMNGKCLLLFSSYKRFERAREILLEKLQGELDIFYQGMSGKVVEDFKKSKFAVLLGLESFGEGIDIPGENLQFLYIDKVPDMNKELVYEKRRDFFDKNFGNSFSEYYMASRIRKLQQKLGRLIRTSSDRGFILLTDPRLGRWKSRTISEFQNSLRPYEMKVIPFEKATQLILEEFS
jgi:ATP-dependent DNA helicase DinG